MRVSDSMMRWFVVWACLCWGSVTAWAMSDSQGMLSSEGNKKAIVVDVGSTGSRLYLYQYQQISDHIQRVRLLATQKVTPGLATVSFDKIPPYLSALFSQAVRAHLPSNEQAAVPVYFYATAGMRLISAAHQARYYDAVTHWLMNNMAFRTVDARTIQGKQEGGYAWIAVNALDKWSQSTTIGVLDMGGGRQYKLLFCLGVMMQRLPCMSMVKTILYLLAPIWDWDKIKL